jgi:hypothetical protein
MSPYMQLQLKFEFILTFNTQPSSWQLKKYIFLVTTVILNGQQGCLIQI